VKASDYIEGFLHEQGVRQVYQVIGGMTTHLVDSLHRGGRVKLVCVNHEQAAAFAADSVGRLTGIPGVAMATSGPGAVNLLTGMGSCHFDSSPAVFITGQVNRHEQRGDRPIRQLGFQETDIVAMAGPVTKAAFRVRSPEELPKLLEDSFRIAVSGRPGPVLLDIPMDVQRMEVSAPFPAPVSRDEGSVPDLDEVLQALSSAQKPLILAGGGVRAARAQDLLREFAQTTGTPLVHSLMAVDSLPSGHPLRAGLIGTYGNRWANLALGRSDLLLVLGSRLDVRQTGSETGFLTQGRTVIHVDCEPGEMNNRVQGCRALQAHLADFLQAALRLARSRKSPERREWLSEIRSLEAKWPDSTECGELRGINPNSFLRRLSESSGGADVFIADVGQHQMWAAQSLRLAEGQRFMTSGGMGAMGFALPAGIGCCFAAPDRPHVVVAGDGGFQVNIQELQTVVRDRLPLKMIVLDNGCLGMVRQFQESYFGSRYAATRWGYSAPDFKAVAQAFGIDAGLIEHPREIDAGLAGLWKTPEGPSLLHVKIPLQANVYPKVAFGRPLTEMEPFAKPLEMEET